jgi:hypothetical protein
MTNYLLQRFRLFYHYYFSRSKYDIHSPFVYNLYSVVLKDKKYYPEFHTLIKKTNGCRKVISGKDYRLLFRLSRFFKPKTILILGTNDKTGISFLVSGFPGCHITYIDESYSRIDDCGVFDMLFFSSNPDGYKIPDYFSRIKQHIHNDSVLIFCKIHGSKEMGDVWNEIKSLSFVTLTLDLFNLGLVFCKEELTREDFILRF